MMKTWCRTAGVFCATALAALGMAVGQEADLPIKGLRVPLELFKDGSVKMQLSAAQAHAPEGGGEVEAAGAVIESFNADGSLAMVMEAERCWFSRATGRIDSTGPVRMDRGDIEISGVGMEWKPDEQKLRLYSHVRLVLKDSAGLGKVFPSKKMANSGATGRKRRSQEGGE